MLRILKSVRAVCQFCREAGRCYQLEADDGSIKGDFCVKCMDRWIDPRSEYEKAPRKVSNGKPSRETAKAEATLVRGRPNFND